MVLLPIDGTDEVAMKSIASEIASINPDFAANIQLWTPITKSGMRYEQQSTGHRLSKAKILNI